MAPDGRPPGRIPRQPSPRRIVSSTTDSTQSACKRRDPRGAAAARHHCHTRHSACCRLIGYLTLSSRRSLPRNEDEPGGRIEWGFAPQAAVVTLYIRSRVVAKEKSIGSRNISARDSKSAPRCWARNTSTKRWPAADDFTKPLQDLVTEYCWGAVWGRDDLPLKTRSMLNLAMISVLNRPHELRTHVKAALTNGVTRDEIREIFLQVAIYAGVPAAVDSFRIAR